METSPQIIAVKDQEEGLNYAKEILYKKSDNQTLLFLSGGSTPKNLYETLAKEKKLMVGAVGVVDERRDGSNFEMIKQTGLVTYLKNAEIDFYPIVSSNAYNKKISSFINSSKNKIAVMGIGEDGHTAGLPASPKLQRGEPAAIFNSQFSISNNKNLVTEIDNFPGEFKKRITLTFRALSEMDLLIILVFGSSKQNALSIMFTKGSEEEIPARFYLRPEIAKKTILITDQKI